MRFFSPEAWIGIKGLFGALFEQIGWFVVGIGFLNKLNSVHNLAGLNNLFFFSFVELGSWKQLGSLGAVDLVSNALYCVILNVGRGIKVLNVVDVFSEERKLLGALDLLFLTVEEFGFKPGGHLFACWFVVTVLLKRIGFNLRI
jgi:hypothetical protein